MAGPAPPRCQRVAFNFDLVQRNAALEERGLKSKFMKTGTTIVGVVYKDGVILGADTRASAGSIVADTQCMKIHKMAPNIYCCGAGTAADCDHVTKTVESSLNLFRFQTERETRVKHAETVLKRHLHKYQGHIGAHLVLGGVDLDGPQLVSISHHGFCKHHNFLAMGSGSLAATAVLDTQYEDNMDEAQARRVVANAIKAGIYHDLGSGGNVDMCAISKINGKTEVDYKRSWEVPPAEKEYKRQFPHQFPKGSTGILAEELERLFEVSDSKMDIDA